MLLKAVGEAREPLEEETLAGEVEELPEMLDQKQHFVPLALLMKPHVH